MQGRQIRVQVKPSFTSCQAAGGRQMQVGDLKNDDSKR